MSNIEDYANLIYGQNMIDVAPTKEELAAPGQPGGRVFEIKELDGTVKRIRLTRAQWRKALHGKHDEGRSAESKDSRRKAHKRERHARTLSRRGN